MAELAVPLGKGGGVAVSLAAPGQRLGVVQNKDGFTGVLVVGASLLRVGTTLLPLDPAREEAFAVFGLDAEGRSVAHVEAWLPQKEQPIVTGHGVVELAGSTGSTVDVHVEGDGAEITGFDVSGALTHSALRLPVSATTPTVYADLGRLDFEAFRLALTLDLSKPPALHSRSLPDGVLPLDKAPGKPVELSLNKARLTVRRQRDLLSLAFGFRGVTLEYGAGPPILRLPAGAGSACPDPAHPPTLRVEFPPQHVEEHALFRQRKLAPPLTVELTDPQKAQARNPAQRPDLYASLDRSGAHANLGPFVKLYWEGLTLAGLDATHPDWWWFGEEFTFSVTARRVGREAAGTVADTAARDWIKGLRLGLDQETLQRAVAQYKPTDAASAAALLDELLRQAEARDEGHALMQSTWRKLHPGARRFYSTGWKGVWANEPALRPIGAWDNETFWRLLPVSGPDGGVLKDTLAMMAAEKAGAAGPVEARAAGVTLLVFDLPCHPARRPYALDVLLDWKDLPLRVSARAERFEPSSQDDVATRLTTLGLVAGGTAAERMAKIRDTIAEARLAPALHDIEALTSIEIPARLYLAPASDTRMRSVPEPSKPGPAPLWRAEMHEAMGRPASLRAIGSPDFDPAAFTPGGHGPNHELGGSFLERLSFRTALNGFDRHQLVGLSSTYGLPVIPRKVNGDKLDPSQIAPPPNWVLGGVSDLDHEQAIYVPRALPTRLLTLSSMGATLDFDARFTPPAALRQDDGTNLFDAFSIERVHGRFVLGRTILTEVLYRGFLMPFGHRATLVKVSERRFEPVEGDDPPALAVLTQRLYIEVAAPDKTFPATGQPLAGRGFPSSAIRLVTTRTPDLIEPFDPAGTTDALDERSSGALVRKDQVGLVFWPRTSRGTAGDVAFRMRVDGAADAVTLPLLFVDNQAAHDYRTMQLVQGYYNGLDKSDGRKRVRHNGAKRRYATPRRPGDTTFETMEWLLRLDSLLEEPVIAPPTPTPTQGGDYHAYSFTPALEGDNQPPLYPRLEEAVIQHGPAARFSGQAQALLTVTYYSKYLKTGFKSQDEESARQGGLGGDIYLDVIAPTDARLDFGDGGDKGGALGRPSQFIRAVARIGPVGATDGKAACNPAPAVRGQIPTAFDSNFFDDDAKLLGLISLRKLVENAIGAGAPILREVIGFVCNAIETTGTVLLPHLKQVQQTFAGSGGILPAIYPEASHAIDISVDSVGRLVGACDPMAVQDAAAALGQLRHALERIAAAPLSALQDLGRKAVEDLRQQLQDALNHVVVPILATDDDIAAFLDSARLWLQPFTAVWLLAGAAKADADALADPAIERKLETALRDAVTQALKPPLPPTLAECRTKIATKAKDDILAMDVPRQALPARQWLADNSFDAIRHLPDRPVLASLYELALAARAWPEVADSLTDTMRKLIAEASALTETAVCAQLQTLTQAALPPIDPAAFACQSDVACSSSHAGPDWCAQLWASLCALRNPYRQTLAGKTQAVIDAMHPLVTKLTALVNDPVCDRDSLLRAWQLLPGEWVLVAEAGNTLIGALEQAAISASVDVSGAAPAEADLRKLGLLVVGRLFAVVPLPAESAYEDLRKALKQTHDAIDALAKSGALQTQLGLVSDGLAALRLAIIDLPNKIIDLMVVGRAVQAGRQRVSEIAATLRQALRTAYAEVVRLRGAGVGVLNLAEATIDSATGGAAPPSGSELACALFDGPNGGACSIGTADGLTREQAGLDDGTDLEVVTRILRRWSDKTASPQKIIAQLGTKLQAAAAAKVVQLLNLQDLRRQVEETLASLVPTTITNTYSYALPIHDYCPFTGVTFRPEADGALTLSATAQADLTQPGKPPTVTIEARLAPFEIDLLNAIALKFKPFTYVAGTGRKGTLEAPFDKVILKEDLIFLAALAAWFTYEDSGSQPGKKPRNGPYLEPRLAGAGLLAGYRLAIPAFSIGPVGFANIALDAHIDMPFDGGEGFAALALSTRRSPLTISYLPYGGSGFAEIDTDAHGTKRMDVSLEFGGAAIVKYGPLDGIGRVMTGFYITQSRSGPCSGMPPKLYGTHSASFTGTVAGFGVASCFYLAMTFDKGSLAGSAELSFSFSVGITDLLISVHVERDEGGKLESGASAGVTPSGQRQQAPAQQPATVKPTAWIPVQAAPVHAGRASTDVPSPAQDWLAHRKLFDTALRGKGSRRAAA